MRPPASPLNGAKSATSPAFRLTARTYASACAFVIALDPPQPPSSGVLTTTATAHARNPLTPGIISRRACIAGIASSAWPEAAFLRLSSSRRQRGGRDRDCAPPCRPGSRARNPSGPIGFRAVESQGGNRSADAPRRLPPQRRSQRRKDLVRAL